MKKIRRWVMMLLLFGTAAAAGFVVQREGELQAVFYEREGRQVKVIAHRGGSANAPENTLAALEQAVLAGADLAEIDLRMTRDGEIIALHDQNLTRTTGVNRMVSDLDLWAVRELDAGDWFSPEFEGERIPTLTELLDTAKDRIALMLELKHTPSDHMLLERVLEQIGSRGMEEGCAVAAADLDILRRSKELAPDVKTVYIGEKTKPEQWGLPYVDGYSICLSGLTAQDVEQAHREGRELYAWTVNSHQEMREALSLGVDGLVTDAPTLALELLGRNPALSEAQTGMAGR